MAELVIGRTSQSVRRTTKKGETGKGREAHGYFVCVEDPDGVVDAYVVQDMMLDEQRLCECVREAGSKSGCNGSARWLDCSSCSKRLATVSRKRVEGTSAARWVYLMISLFKKLIGKPMQRAARKSLMLNLATQYRANGAKRIINNVMLQTDSRRSRAAVWLGAGAAGAASSTAGT